MSEVNKLGGKEVVGQIGGGYKAQGSDRDFIEVISPEGEAMKFSPSNARDLVRRGEGWKIATPSNITPWDAKTHVAKDADKDATKGQQTEQQSSTDESKPGEPTNELEVLRAEATALDIPFDLRWGKKRLNAEIETAKEHLSEDEKVDSEETE